MEFIFKSNGEVKKLVDLIYPIGSIYASTSPTNPGTLFGGTWEAYAQGRTLVGAGTGNDGSTSMSFTATTYGGEYRHKLSLDEMPRHYHKTVKGQRDNGTPNVDYPYTTYQAEESIPLGSYYTSRTMSEGKDQLHNNIQPYICIYFWRRIA